MVAISKNLAASLSLANYISPGIDAAHVAQEIAHAAGVAFPVFTSYLGHKYWSFR